MYTKLVLFISSLSILVGCSSDPTSLMRSPSAIKENLYSLEGQSTAQAIKKLGLPKEEKTIVGQTVLVWYEAGDNTRTLGSTVRPTFGGNYVVNTYSREFYCVVSAVVKNDVITSVEIEANSVYYCPGQRK